MHTGPGSRGAFNRGHHKNLFGVFVQRDLDANPRELSGGVDLHLLELFGVQKARVGIIEAGEHASDRFIRLIGAGIALGQQISSQAGPGFRGILS